MKIENDCFDCANSVWSEVDREWVCRITKLFIPKEGIKKEECSSFENEYKKSENNCFDCSNSFWNGEDHKWICNTKKCNIANRGIEAKNCSYFKKEL